MTTKEYDKKLRKAKILEKLAKPIYFGFLALFIIAGYFAIKTSIGNIAEITELLNSAKYTGEQLSANYSFLISKYGEWVIGSGASGFTLTFVDIGNALFSGVVIFNCILAVLSLLISIICGKFVFPIVAKKIRQNLQDDVNRASLDKE